MGYEQLGSDNEEIVVRPFDQLRDFVRPVDAQLLLTGTQHSDAANMLFKEALVPPVAQETLQARVVGSTEGLIAVWPEDPNIIWPDNTRGEI